MNQQNLEQHVTILGWLHIVGHALFLLIGGFIFVLLTSIGAISGEAEAMTVLSIVGTFVAALMALFALPGMVAGYGLLKRKNWARVLAIIVGILSLFNFPIGTAIGAYTLWVLMQPEAVHYFNSPKTPKMA